MLPRITAILYNKKLSRKHDVSKNHRSESNFANKHQSNTPKKEKQQEKIMQARRIKRTDNDHVIAILQKTMCKNTKSTGMT